MKYHKILETTYLKTEAGQGCIGLILEESIKIEIFNKHFFLTWEEALENIKTTKPGWIQQSKTYNSYTEEEINKKSRYHIDKNGIPSLPGTFRDPVGEIKKVFDDFHQYAEKRRSELK